MLSLENAPLEYNIFYYLFMVPSVTPFKTYINTDKGILSPGGLQWFNFDGCESCSENQTSCIQYEIPTNYQLYSQQSCAGEYYYYYLKILALYGSIFNMVHKAECFAYFAADINCKNCSTTIMATFQGNTVSGQPLQSAYQLSSAYQYAISSAFKELLTGFDEDL